MFSRRQTAEFAVIGLGRFGTSVALGLMHDGHHVMGIDRDPVIVQSVSYELTRAVVADATNEMALREIDITAFDGVVVAIGEPFEANLITVLLLKRLGIGRVIGRAHTELQRMALLQIGADQVVMPEDEAGWWFSGLLTSPGVRDYLEVGSEHSVADVAIPAALAGKTLQEAALHKRFGMIVVAVKRATTDEVIAQPPPQYRLAAGDSLILFGADAAFDRLADAMETGW